jgi:hypothetical protein
MRSYMNFAVLALAAASTVSPALSAPTSYGYGNLLEFKIQAIDVYLLY